MDPSSNGKGAKVVKQEQVIGAVAAGAAVTAFTTDAVYADPADFAGAFAGLGFGTNAAEVGMDYMYAIGSDLVPHIFGGYNWLKGNTILGVEVALHGNDTAFLGGEADYGLEGMWDIRARLGTTISDNTMLYGALGYWDADYLFYGDDDAGDASGYSLGIGFETNVGDNGLFVGGDVTFRNTNSSSPKDPSDDDKSPSDITTVSVRVGYRF